MQKLQLLLLFILASVPAFSEVRDSTILKTPSGNIYGTLTTPAKRFSGPVVIIVSGSGPTDRHGNNGLLINNTLDMLSDSLAKYGIASLRYDKRGIGSSKAAAKDESHLVFTDYVKDLQGWMTKLGKDKRFTRIFVLGHSEGSLVGMLAVQHAKAGGFISVAGAGKPADTVIMEQLRINKNATPIFLDSCRWMFDQLRLNGKVENVPGGFYQTLFRKSVQRYLASWLKYDPAVEIKKVTIPTLLIQGRKDIQVDVAQAEILQAAKPDAQLVLIPDMNHIFRDISSDEVADNTGSYFDASLPINSTLVGSVVRFVRTYTARR